MTKIEACNDRQKLQETELTILGYTRFQCYDCNGTSRYFFESPRAVKTWVACIGCNGHGYFWRDKLGVKYFIGTGVDPDWEELDG